MLPRGESGITGAAVAGRRRHRPATWASGTPTIRSAAPIDEGLALEAAAARWQDDDEVAWSDGRVVARRVTRLGAVELSSVGLADPPAERVGAAVRDGLRQEGLGVLPWTEAARALRARMSFLHRTLGEPWPDVSDDALAASVETWLGPELARIRTTRDLARVDVLTALRRLLPWPEAGRLDELGPGAAERAERLRRPGRVRRRAAGARRTPAGDVRLGRDAAAGRRPGAGAAAPALAGRAGRSP